MSLRPASRRCRIINHHPRSPGKTTLTTLLLLVVGLDNPYKHSRISVRHGSFVPGPLENRRRHGRRNMGALNSAHTLPSAPFWDLDNSVDLSNWRWFPPTSPEARRRIDDADDAEIRSAEGSSKLFVAWRSFTSPQMSTDEIQLDDHVEPTKAASLSATLDAEPTVVRRVGNRPSPEAIGNTRSIVVATVHMGLASLYQDISSTALGQSHLNFGLFCDHWARELAAACIDADDVGPILEGIADGIDTASSITNRETVKILLYEATVDGISQKANADASAFDPTVWNDVLCRISTLRINSLRIFEQAMARVPKHQLSLVSSGILANLDTQLKALGRAAKASTIPRQTRKRVEILKRLPLSAHHDIISAATQQALSYAKTQDLNFVQIRSAWLQVLARLPHVDTIHLIQACRALDDSQTNEPLSTREICQLFLAHINRQESVFHVKSYYNNFQAVDSECGYRFGAALWKMGDHGHLKNLCDFLLRLGRDRDVTLLAKHIRRVAGGGAEEVNPLVNLCLGIGKPFEAVEIYCLYEECRNMGTNFWRSSLGTKAVSELLMSSSLKHRKILDVLGLFALSPHMQGYRRARIAWRRRRETRESGIDAGSEVSATLSKSETHRLRLQGWRTSKVATALARANNLSKRTAFDLVSRCIRALRSRDAAIPPDVLRALLHSITRGLAERRPCRHGRVLWFLRLIRRELGNDEMLRTEFSLKQWRRFNLAQSELPSSTDDENSIVSSRGDNEEEILQTAVSGAKVPGSLSSPSPRI